MSIKDLPKSLTFKPKQTIDPFAFQALTLDAISVNLAKSAGIHEESQKILAENQKLLASILQELRNDADEGEFLAQHGTVITTDFTIIETEIAPNHPVKGYSIKNDGPGTIFVAHNISKAGLQPDIDNLTSALSRFWEVRLNEEITFSFNRRKILNVAIIAATVDSDYRAWLSW